MTSVVDTAGVAVLLVCRFAVEPDARPTFLERGRRAVALLGAQSGCRSVELGQATEDDAAWVLVAVFDTAAAYRRALSPFDVREHVIPFLSEALTGDEQPATFERRIAADAADPAGTTEHASVLRPPS